jgi:hypothetical protein
MGATGLILWAYSAYVLFTAFQSGFVWTPIPTRPRAYRRERPIFFWSNIAVFAAIVAICTYTAGARALTYLFN